jgi:hypothetical protein
VIGGPKLLIVVDGWHGVVQQKQNNLNEKHFTIINLMHQGYSAWP